MAKSKMGSNDQPKVLSSKVVYRGPVFHVTRDEVREPSGMKIRRDVVRHPGSVVVLLVDEGRAEPRVLLARQYRHAAARYLWELPAGRVDPGEDPLTGAKRELLEETGYTATEWQRVFFFYASPGFLDEWMALYMARDLKRGEAQPEDDEVISKRLFPVSRAARMVATGTVQDAKTIAGVLWLERVWQQGSLSRKAGKKQATLISSGKKLASGSRSRKTPRKSRRS